MSKSIPASLRLPEDIRQDANREHTLDTGLTKRQNQISNLVQTKLEYHVISND